MNLGILHGSAIDDDAFGIEKEKWYHVTAEIRGDEMLVWFANGPAYFMQHELFREKPQGFEFFTHASEFGILDNVQVWSLAEGEQANWSEELARITEEGRSFLSSENPDFVTQKTKPASPSPKKES